MGLGRGHSHAIVFVWRSEDKPLESVLVLCDPVIELRISDVHSKCFYLLGYLVSSDVTEFCIWLTVVSCAGIITTYNVTNSNY